MKASANSLMVISPYLDCGVWVFDDPAKGLVKEPLIAGMPEIIRHMIGPERDRFTAVFGAVPFPGSQYELRHDGAGPNGGDWYVLEGATLLNGWLCPALLKYFPAAPERIYIEIREAL